MTAPDVTGTASARDQDGGGTGAREHAGKAAAAPAGGGLRLLVVTHYFAEHGGGVERVAAELVERLSPRGFDVTWAASGERQAPGARHAGLANVRPASAGQASAGPASAETANVGQASAGPANAGLPSAGAAGTAPTGWRRVSMRAWNITERALGFPYPLWGPRGLYRLWREVRRSRVVHLHDCLYMGNFAAYLFARAARRPVLVTQHIGFVPYSRRALRLLLGLANRTLGAAVLRGCDRRVFYSPRVSEYFTRLLHLPGPPLLIANGVEGKFFHPVAAEPRRRLRAELGWDAERPLLLFVGRFVEKKGLAILRRLAALLPEPLWVFIGWGPDDPSAWRLPNVQVLPPMLHPELARAYQAADLLVLPSVGEGFPLVVQEAMACGTPALISGETLAACPEIAPVTFAAEPTVEAFVAALRPLLGDPAALPTPSALANPALATIPGLAGMRPEVAAMALRLWSWDVATAAYEKLLRELASPAPAPSTSPQPRRSS